MLLLVTGLACAALGALAIWLPLSLFGTLVGLVGALLLGAGVIKLLQLWPGRRSRAARRQTWALILSQAGLDIAMGLLLLNNRLISQRLVAVAFGLLFLIEGVLLLGMGAKATSFRGRLMLWITAVVTGGIGLAVVFGLVADPIRWAGVMVGLKLLCFGLTLVIIALTARGDADALLLATWVPEPVTGELYSVYFGTAFHLGVYVGGGKIIHYLNDDHVYQVSWEQFLEGRMPQHWTYPDLLAVPVEEIVHTALAEVGKTYDYHLLTFNCEHFAIYCKSGGRVKTSAYAQIPASLEIVRKHPWRGMVAELNTRVVEWLAFHLGGPSGKRLSLAIRRIGSTVTMWLMRPSKRSASGCGQPQ
ncbi:MAG: lecithin retinol acyltransferase family protein [Geminicoccaceae bacterium]